MVSTKLVIPTSLHEYCLKYCVTNGITEPVVEDISVACKNGDSFSGDIYRIHCKSNVSDMTKSFVAKLSPQSELRRSLYRSQQHFAHEKYVFENLLITFKNFQSDRLQDKQLIFDQYPTYITGSLSGDREYLVFEDLAQSNYKNFERSEVMSYENCVTVLSQLAKFHAVSIALRHQKKDEFFAMVENLSEKMFVKPNQMEVMLDRKVECAVNALKKTNIPGDDKIIDKLEEFRHQYFDAMVDCCESKDDAVVVHGDCWISNLMYKENENGIKTVLLLDWQMTRYASPVIDISYFLFCCTDATVRAKIPDLLRKYHSNLVEFVNALGSDGNTLFPFEKLLDHMTKYARFGFGMALMTLQTTACPDEDLPDVVGLLDKLDYAAMNDLDKNFSNHPCYIKRITEASRDAFNYNYI